MRHLWIVPMGVLAAATTGAGQDQLPKGAKPIPATRWEMKQALQALQDAKPRLPLPPDDGEGKGVNNGRMRAYYVPEEIRAGGVGSFAGGFGGARGKDRKEPGKAETRPETKADPAKGDYTFNTKLFWIVSRVNNCQY